MLNIGKVCLFSKKLKINFFFPLTLSQVILEVSITLIQLQRNVFDRLLEVTDGPIFK